ncbi:GntR family transcriptional regulator [Diaphorobacter sp. HDW4B]|uniref:GntR family transcriptional regulator n=1 Tax=Diaphorobacter sp. HDW4B TaxID=2714925 RepID=UPI00140E0144|nr:GntR family transcriptional regulator [Diaphorobacter sp. HDW4B]QIL69457.1 GntR family transcriptional regulator [Diaphorobacter sp. HDW4B]
MSSNSTSPSSSAVANAGAGGVSTPAFSPLYQQIKGLILHSLQHGEWKPGEVIPSEMDLAARFRVSQGTVRKAIDELASDNLLVRRQGKGTFVATHAEQQVQYRFLKLLPDSGDVREEGPAQRTILECKRNRASAEIARALQIRTGDPIIQARRILAFAGVPTILEDIWLPGQAFKGLTAEQMANYHGPTYAMFELDYGVRMVRAEEKIRAVVPDDEQANLLLVPPHTPLLSVERIAYTYNDVPMELRRALYRTDTHHYHNSLS